MLLHVLVFIFVFKQKTAYEMRISDWSSDVCSSDLRAIWNETLTRIEMHLEATRNVDFTIDDHGFAMAAGETIHTENSHKYGPRDARMLLLAGEWTPVAEWTDADDRFALLLAEARPRRKAP